MWNVKRDETMTEIKDYLVMMVGVVFSLLSPIQGFMWAMVCLFALNFGFGLLAAIVKKEGWSTKKALWFFVYCAIFFVTAASVFIIGHFMENEREAVAVVKFMCFMAIYVFGVNILRNWRQVLREGTAWWKLVDLLYYVLTVKFIERFSIVKKWQGNQKPDGDPSGARNEEGGVRKEE